MKYCPKCGQETSETDNFCRHCGYNLSKERSSLSASEEAIKTVIIQRVNAIKLRDDQVLRRLIDGERYTKFDDWPPFERQGLEAIDREADALKVLRDYGYEVSDWRIDLYDDAALASFIIYYYGRIRDLDFKVRSRVTVFLVKREEGWRIVNEHWSRFPREDEAIKARHGALFL
ncbi:zinc ribbon domain-containing protein [Candidatus Bathyarchaeota archaeon]|nr:zinc ribbon domain-containing protein [Candidatus Bathyarchaeota archaeon]MBS7630586.1 zinc ribbon domain-containing protein [Candidatus Bathyarchaeota archaeon]